MNNNISKALCIQEGKTADSLTTLCGIDSKLFPKHYKRNVYVLSEIPELSDQTTSQNPYLQSLIKTTVYISFRTPFSILSYKQSFYLPKTLFSSKNLIPRDPQYLTRLFYKILLLEFQNRRAQHQSIVDSFQELVDLFNEYPESFSSTFMRKLINLIQLPQIHDFLENPVNKDHFYKFIKSCIFKDHQRTLSILNHIKAFNEKDKIEIAKYFAHKTSSIIHYVSESLQIRSEKGRYEIAKICIDNDPLLTIDSLHKFHITNQKYLYDLAEISADSDPQSTAKYIEKFNIQEPLYLSCIAALCIENMGSDFHEYFENFPINFDLNFISLCLSFSNWSEEQIDVLKQLQTDDLIISLRYPKMRFTLLQLLLEIDFDDIDDFLNTYKRLNNNSRIHGILPSLLIASLNLEAENEGYEDDFSVFADKIHQNKQLRDKIYLPPILKLLSFLNEEENLSISDKKFLLTLVFSNENKKLIKKKAELILSIQNISSIEKLTQEYLEKHNINLEQILEETFQQKIPVAIENFSENYLNTFGVFRDSTAIIRYYAKLNTLSYRDRSICLDSLKLFIESILSDSFHETRYSTTTNPHLKTIFEDEILEENWKRKQRVYPLTEWIDDSQTLDTPTFSSIIPEIFSIYLENYSYLNTYLETFDASTICENITERMTVTKGHEREYLRLQHSCITLCESTNLHHQITLIKKIIHLSETLNLLPLTQKFEEEIAKLYQIQRTISSKYDNWTIQISDDPEDLLLSGTEIETCQSIDGDASHNKGLLGLILNGQNKIITIKSSNKKIKARAIIRLLWDSIGHKPVLFIEETYALWDIEEHVHNAIKKIASQYAEELSIDLFDESYPNRIYSLGGTAPYGYCDFAGGITEGDVFSISNHSSAIH